GGGAGGPGGRAATGTGAEVAANALLQYGAADARPGLVLLSRESCGNPRRFSRIARALSRTKPIVAVKSGGAARAYPSGDGDEEGAEVEVTAANLEALVAQTGIVRVDTLAQQLHVARGLASQPPPAGGRGAPVGHGGGAPGPGPRGRASMPG